MSKPKEKKMSSNCPAFVSHNVAIKIITREGKLTLVDEIK